MRSLRESFSIWSNKGAGPSLGPMPKSAAGFLPHREEQQLAKLWSEMIRSEGGCRSVVAAVRQCGEEAAAVQGEEERLLARLQQDTAALQASSSLLAAGLHALHDLLPQVRESVPESAERLESEVSESVREYHSLYQSVESVKTKRDLLVADLNRIQDRLEKLRLKGKRSTDVLVEKEKCQRQLQEVQAHLLQEVAAFHNLRTAYFLHCLHSYADTQFLQYGAQAEQYKTHIVGGLAHHPNLARINGSSTQHLAKLKALNITDS